VPVIIVSSLASDAYKQRGVEVGAQAYMTKGQFDQGRLLETIDLLIH
jgi:two-component system, chemotaxis family, sensor kinase CheA